MEAGREEGLLPEAARVRCEGLGEGEVWLEKSCSFVEEDTGLSAKACGEAESLGLVGTMASWCGVASTGDEGEGEWGWWLHWERKLETVWQLTPTFNTVLQYVHAS